MDTTDCTRHSSDDRQASILEEKENIQPVSEDEKDAVKGIGNAQVPSKQERAPSDVLGGKQSSGKKRPRELDSDSDEDGNGRVEDKKGM